MRIDVKLDGIDELMKVLNEKAYNKALKRTIRRMGQRFRTTATKEVRKTYNIKASKIKQYMRAKMDGDTFKMYIKSPTVSLMNFGARQTKKGVSVKVRKDRGRKVIKGAFIAVGKNNNLQVFKRVGKERLPIESKKTLSIPQMFNENVLNKAKSAVEESYENEFKRNFDFYLGRS